jgi:hypothetical protein
MAWTAHGYFATVGIDDLVAFLGERRLDRSDVPPELEPYVEPALTRGLVFEDCRDKLAVLT